MKRIILSIMATGLMLGNTAQIIAGNSLSGLAARAGALAARAGAYLAHPQINQEELAILEQERAINAQNELLMQALERSDRERAASQRKTNETWAAFATSLAQHCDKHNYFANKTITVNGFNFTVAFTPLAPNKVLPQGPTTRKITISLPQAPEIEVTKQVFFPSPLVNAYARINTAYEVVDYEFNTEYGNNVLAIVKEEVEAVYKNLPPEILFGDMKNAAKTK